jgi:hypothetical protein
VIITNQTSFPLAALRSEGCELPEIEQYRWIVEEAVFEHLGRPSFFDHAVERVMAKLKARIEKRGSANSQTLHAHSCHRNLQSKAPATAGTCASRHG